MESYRCSLARLLQRGDDDYEVTPNAPFVRQSRQSLKTIVKKSKFEFDMNRQPPGRCPMTGCRYNLKGKNMGALRNQHWDDIGEDVKAALQKDAARFLGSI